MKNANVVRTAAVASLAALVMATGMIASREGAIEAPMASIAAESAPASYFSAAYELNPRVDEPDVLEYY